MRNLTLIAAAVLALACGNPALAQPTTQTKRPFRALFASPVIVCDTNGQATEIFKGFAKSIGDGAITFWTLNDVVDKRQEHACRFEDFVRLDLTGKPTEMIGPKRPDGTKLDAIIEPVRDSVTKVDGWLLMEMPTPGHVSAPPTSLLPL